MPNALSTASIYQNRPSVVSCTFDVSREATSVIKLYARTGLRKPTMYETSSLLSASSAVHVHTSPQPAAFCSGVTRLSFAPTKDQISSHCTRFDFRPRTFSSWNAAQTRPASTNSFETVLIETSHKRETERIDDPSQSIERMSARLAADNLFM